MLDTCDPCIGEVEGFADSPMCDKVPDALVYAMIGLN